MNDPEPVLCKDCKFRKRWYGQIEHNVCIKVPLSTNPVYGTQTYKACEEVNHSCQCTMFEARDLKSQIKWWQFWKLI